MNLSVYNNSIWHQRVIKCLVNQHGTSSQLKRAAAGPTLIKPHGGGSDEAECSRVFAPKQLIVGTVQVTCGTVLLLAPDPTCLVCGDVDHGIQRHLVAQVRHSVCGQDAEGVVSVSHQVQHCHPGLCQPRLTRDESNCCGARSLHQPSSASPNAGACNRLPST